ENAESRAVQKSRNHIFLIELVPGGKGEGVDTAEITVRRILDELFDRAYRLRLRRLSQNSEEVFAFAGKFHVTIRLITVAVTVCLGKTESKRQMRQKTSGSVPTFDTIVSSSPPGLWDLSVLDDCCASSRSLVGKKCHFADASTPRPE